MAIRYGLGKGLREPCSPYRQAYFFGAALNSVDADGWKCNPEIVDPATSFDLSRITEYHEVCVALIAVSSAKSGTYRFIFEFYKERTNKLLFDWVWEYNASAEGWVYSYAYLGWTPWEINENGAYRVDLRVEGAQYWSVSIPFTVTGIPAEPVPPPEPTPGVSVIVELLNSVSAFFYSVYVWFLGIPLIPIEATNFFYSLSGAFNNLAWAFYHFNKWVTLVTSRIAGILNLDQIIVALRTWLNYATWAWEWIGGAWDNVTGIIGDWWSTVRVTVQGWIQAATEGLDELKSAWGQFTKVTLVNISDQIASLFNTWHQFWTTTFPTLVSFAWLDIWWADRLREVDTLVDSAVARWFPFYDDLTQLWEEIKSFFSDPLQWVYNKLDEFFERFW